MNERHSEEFALKITVSECTGQRGKLTHARERRVATLLLR